MNTEDILNEVKWTRPSDYGGFSPDGDFVIAARTRDSDCLERSNYDCILRDLNAHALEGRENDRPMVYDFRAGHWACGWVEYILVRNDAPESIKDAAAEIICALADYPVYDESHFSELEHQESCDYWASLSIRERAQIIIDHGESASIFEARHDCPPQDSGILNYLTEG